jgi:hypothetical protein
MVEYPNAPLPDLGSGPGPAPAPGRVPAPRGSSRGTSILFAVAGLIAVGGLAFAVGRLTAPPAAAANGRFGAGAGGFRAGFGVNASTAPGQGGRFGGAFGGEVALRGTVQSINAETLTLQTASGATVTIELSGSTTYHRQAAATASDVTPGSQVLVQVAFNRAALGAGPAASGAPQASSAGRTFSASDVTLLTTP